MKLVFLTTLDDQKTIYVSADHIVAIRPDQLAEEPCCLVVTDSGVEWHVAESAQHVASLLIDPYSITPPGSPGSLRQ